MSYCSPKVSASPVLSGPHKTTINMRNGLKQGCPLSPILFKFLLDPLLTKLARANVLTWGLEDDLALAVTELLSLGRLLQHIEAFNEASVARPPRPRHTWCQLGKSVKPSANATPPSHMEFDGVGVVGDREVERAGDAAAAQETCNVESSHVTERLS